MLTPPQHRTEQMKKPVATGRALQQRIRFETKRISGQTTHLVEKQKRTVSNNALSFRNDLYPQTRKLRRRGKNTIFQFRNASPFRRKRFFCCDEAIVLSFQKTPIQQNTHVTETHIYRNASVGPG